MPNTITPGGKFHGNISENMTLGNIFEQIVVNQKYGWLFLKYSQKEVRLYFQGDLVGLVTPPQEKIQALPQKLCFAGKLSEEDYRKIMESEEPLHVLEQTLSEDEISASLNNICYDEICALFMLYEGYFEFIDQNQQEVDANLSPVGKMFESEGILIEAANRQQEWQSMYGTLPDHDEILIPTQQELLAGYPSEDPVQAVLTLANHRTLHEVLLYSYISEFDTLRILCSLIAEGKLRLLTEEELKSYAAEFEAKEQWHKAIMYYQVLIKRNPMDNVACDTLAVCYEKTGQQQLLPNLYAMLANPLLGSTKKTEQIQGALYLKKFGEVAPDTPEGVEARLHLFNLVSQQIIDAKTIGYNTLMEGKQLFQILRHRKEDVKARQLLEVILALAPHDKSLVGQYINVCLDLRDTDSAVAQYENMAKMFERDHNWKELEGIYQKIVKLAPDRLDIAQKLEGFKKYKGGASWKRAVAVILILAALGAGGWFGFQEYLKLNNHTVPPVKPNTANGTKITEPKVPDSLDAWREKEKKMDSEAEALVRKATKAMEEWDIAYAKTCLEDALKKSRSEYVCIFMADGLDIRGMNNGILPESLPGIFEKNGYTLSVDATIKTKKQDEEWIVDDLGQKEIQKETYWILKEKNAFKINKDLKTKLSSLSVVVKKYLDEFQEKWESGKAKEQSGELMKARGIYLELWQNSNFAKMPDYKNIKLSFAWEISPPNAIVKVDGQQIEKSSLITCPPNFQEIEISLYGYRPEMYFNSLVPLPTLVKSKNAKPIPDEDRSKIKLEKTVLWETTIEEDNKRNALVVEGAPCYQNGTLYIAGRNDTLYAFKDITEGSPPQRLWKIKIRALSSFTTTPCVHEGILYIGGNNGVVYAVDAVKGVVKHQYQIEKKPLIHSSPVVAVAQKLVILGAGDGFIYAFPLVDASITTWKPSWKYPAEKKIESSPVLVKDKLIIGSTNKILYAINLANKVAPAWRKTLAAPVESTPVVDNDIIYIGAGSTLYAITAEGKENWSCKVSGNIVGKLLIHENTIYCVSDAKRLYAIGKNGDKLWDSSEKPWGKSLHALKNAPMIGPRNILYLGDLRLIQDEKDGTKKAGSIYAILENGDLLWDYKIGVEIFAMPVMVGNIVVIGVDKLYGFLDN